MNDEDINTLRHLRKLSLEGRLHRKTESIEGLSKRGFDELKTEDKIKYIKFFTPNIIVVYEKKDDKYAKHEGFYIRQR